MKLFKLFCATSAIAVPTMGTIIMIAMTLSNPWTPAGFQDEKTVLSSNQTSKSQSIDQSGSKI